MDLETKKDLSLKTIRGNNTVNMLKSLLRTGEMTRSDLAAENGISIMTVKHIVDDLLAAGVVVERIGKGGEVGRKPKVLEISEQYGHIVCINLTTANAVTFLVYDIYRTLLTEQTVVFTAETVYKDNLRKAMEQMKAYSDALPTKLVGAALFVPSAYYEAEDLINYDLVHEFKDLHIRSLSREVFQIDNILVLHDVFPAAQSEYDSLDPTCESQFYFYCGYGVGGFFIHHNIAVIGEELMAGEVGKLILSVDENGKFITTEDCVAIPALLRAYGQPEAEFETLIQAYLAGEERAKLVVDPALDTLSRLLYNLLWVYNPTRLVIDSCNKTYSALIVQRMEQFLQMTRDEAIPIRVQIRQAQYDEYHWMRGCFHMVRDHWVKQLAEG